MDVLLVDKGVILVPDELAVNFGSYGEVREQIEVVIAKVPDWLFAFHNGKLRWVRELRVEDFRKVDGAVVECEIEVLSGCREDNELLVDEYVAEGSDFEGI